jgi:hypothetical protein
MAIWKKKFIQTQRFKALKDPTLYLIYGLKSIKNPFRLIKSSFKVILAPCKHVVFNS